ncbi:MULTISPECIES: hypothetical protein [Salinibaculum]
MRPIPHHGNRGEETDERVRLTTRREAAEKLEDDETWIAVQEF